MNVRLDSVCDIIMGQAPAGDEYNDQGEGLPLLAGAGDFKNGRPAAKKFTRVVTKQCIEGDLVIGIRASIGDKVIADRPYCLGRGVAVIRPKAKDMAPRYLWHWMTAIRPELERKAKGATFKQVNRADIGELRLTLPPLDEQRRIAAILDQAEELRAKRRAAIALLDQLPQAIFLEMFGDPASNPKGWQTKPLKAVTTKIGSGSTPTGGESAYKSEGIALIRSMNIHDGHFVPKGLAYVDEEQAAKLANVVVAPNDVLLNITGASVARVALVPKGVLPARVNQHVSILRCAQELSPRFLESLLINPSTKKSLLRVAGAGATREAITKEQLESFEILLPPTEAQELFAGRVEAISCVKSTHQAALVELDALFASLQAASFSGSTSS